MKNTIFYLLLICFVFTSCQKDINELRQIIAPKQGAAASNFVKYTIKKGTQYSDLNNVMKVAYEELNFIVKFDSSAVYTTTIPSNQFDINKLYGFSDNNAQHHEFSARFGWNWSKNGLQLFAYTYNNAVREHKLLGIVPLGEEINCSIKVAGDKYIFTLNNKVETMPRASTGAKAEGYKLYPYFGGDEMAPHDITIAIKETKSL